MYKIKTLIKVIKGNLKKQKCAIQWRTQYYSNYLFPQTSLSIYCNPNQNQTFLQNQILKYTCQADETTTKRITKLLQIALAVTESNLY